MNVVDLLRNDEEYYTGVGKNFISTSSINHYINTCEFLPQPFKVTKQLLQGELLHKMILEKDKIDDVPVAPCRTRRTKLYNNYLRENNLNIALTGNEVDKVDYWVDKIMGDYDLLINDKNAVYEEPAIGMIRDMPFKGKADIINRELGCIYDIKTTGNIERFPKSVKSFNYHIQAVVYKKLFNVDDFMFILVDKRTGEVGSYRLSEEEEKIANDVLYCLNMIYNYNKDNNKYIPKGL